MSFFDTCPGSKRIREPFPETMTCACGREIEIWSDEAETTCPYCGKKARRYMPGSCLDWCSMAKECIGEGAYANYMKNKAMTLKETLIKKIEAYFGKDAKRILHAKKVMSFAEELLKHENADWHIVIPASILHDVGIKAAEEKYGSSAGCLQEKEGPAIARDILNKSGLKKEDISQICEIIAHHHSPGKLATRNFKVLYDADRLVNIEEEYNIKDKEALREAIDKTFLTDRGKKLAIEIYLSHHKRES